MNISIEIVARNEEQITETLRQVRDFCPIVNTINVPDILRYKMRSWDAVPLVNPHYPHVIPHIRAVDFDLHKPFPLIEQIARDGITEILVISGDADKNSLHPVYPTTSIPLIKKLKQELPDLTIFAGIDPYRGNIQSELRYSAEKIEAGADGLFTQPFFDLRLMEIYADMLPKVPIYWGVSPVMTENSRNYWETVNRVVFPSDYAFTLEGNRQFARAALDFAQAHSGHIYFMPIRVDIREYLYGIF